VTEQPKDTATDLAAAILRADEGRRTSPPPVPKGWAGLVERDRRARRDSHGNAAGGFGLLLYPVRLYVLLASALLIPILIVISIVR
jgi:hypothetical protein